MSIHIRESDEARFPVDGRQGLGLGWGSSGLVEERARVVVEDVVAATSGVRPEELMRWQQPLDG